MATKIIKTLKLPNNEDSYQINAALLDNMTASEIREGLTTLSERVSNKADKTDIPRNYVSYAAISNVNIAGNVTTVYKHQFSAVPTILVPTTEQGYAVPMTTRQNIIPSEADYLSNVVVDPIPSEYVIPEGEKTVTTTGSHDVSGYASVDVNIPTYEGEIDIVELTEE